MIIELSNLNYKNKIEIEEVIDYDFDYIKNSGILELKNICVSGKIEKDYEGNNQIILKVLGKMMITDAITTETVPYDFEIEIEEILENSLKTLDLIEFLWHYIVLEIPIRYTTSDTKVLKDKYQDIYEEEEVREVNNPFKDFFNE